MTKSVAVFSASGLYAVVGSRAAASRLTGVSGTKISASILQQAPGAQSAAGYARSGAPLLRKGTPPPSQEPGKGSTSDWSREPMQMFAFTDSHITVEEFEAKKADVGVADLIEDLPEYLRAFAEAVSGATKGDKRRADAPALAPNAK
eukprot:COSAG01_NODE_31591_length_595_cov_0.729839_1_plen_146_part_01